MTDSDALSPFLVDLSLKDVKDDEPCVCPFPFDNPPSHYPHHCVRCGACERAFRNEISKDGGF